MRIDDKKSIFKVSLSDADRGWGSKEVVIIANDYNHAKSLAEEYVQFEKVEEAKLLDADGSLSKSAEGMKVISIQEIFNRIVF